MSPGTFVHDLATPIHGRGARRCTGGVLGGCAALRSESGFTDGPGAVRIGGLCREARVFRDLRRHFIFEYYPWYIGYHNPDEGRWRLELLRICSASSRPLNDLPGLFLHS
jgi:hypothetical protein